MFVCLFVLSFQVGAGTFTGRYITAREGDDISIECNVPIGNNDTVFWSKNDTSGSFTQLGEGLNLVNIKPNSAGCYICYLLHTSFPEHNGTMGKEIMDVVNIVVEGKLIDLKYFRIFKLFVPFYT